MLGRSWIDIATGTVSANIREPIICAKVMVEEGTPARTVVVGRSLLRVQLGASTSIAAGGRLTKVSKMRADWINDGILILGEEVD
jgi:hypothetical protein